MKDDYSAVAADLIERMSRSSRAQVQPLPTSTVNADGMRLVINRPANCTIIVGACANLGAPQPGAMGCPPTPNSNT